VVADFFAEIPAAAGPPAEAGPADLPKGDQDQARGHKDQPVGNKDQPGGDKDLPGGDKDLPGGNKDQPGGDEDVPGDGDDAEPRTGTAEPLAGGTAYVLKAILHDWDDARSLDLLRTCRRAMGEKSTLLIIERLLEEGNVEAAISDLNMMVGPGGLERTATEYRDLLAAAGLRLTRTVRTASEVAVLEATAG
jgi:hypothetical protein